MYCLFDSEATRAPVGNQEDAGSLNPKLQFLADSNMEEIVAMYEVSNFLEDIARHTLEYNDIRVEGERGGTLA